MKTGSTYRDQKILPNTAYSYKVRGEQKIGGKQVGSKYSKSYKARVTFAGASIKTMKVKSGHTCTLEFSDQLNADSYEVWYRLSSEKSYRKIKTVADKNRKTYQVSFSIPYGKKYYVKIRTVTKLNKKTYQKWTPSKQGYLPKPASKRLNVKCILQYPKYPSGCEAVSLSIVLKYLGFPISTSQLISKYLPIQSNFTGGLTFNQAYLGQISSTASWGGCYPPVIVQAAKSYLKSVKSKKYLPKDITGSSLEKLYDYLLEGSPVIAWCTMYLSGSHPFLVGLSNYGTLYWQSGSHALVLTGYDKKKGIVYVSDPLVGNTSYNSNVFLQKYKQLGYRAVVLQQEG